MNSCVASVILTQRHFGFILNSYTPFWCDIRPVYMQQGEGEGIFVIRFGFLVFHMWNKLRALFWTIDLRRNCLKSNVQDRHLKN